MARKDPEARREYHRQYMRDRLANDPAYKSAHLARVRRNDQKSRETARLLIAEFKMGGCICCQEAEPICLSAHHLNAGEKDFNLADAARIKMSPARVRAELAKCVCLCHNCHAKVHAGLIEL